MTRPSRHRSWRGVDAVLFTTVLPHSLKFIALFATAAVAWPLAARAQQSPKLPTIGFLGPNTSSLDSHSVGAFVQRLRELGWIEGRNVAIEYRWAEGRIEHLAEFVAESVRLKVDVIVTSGTPAVVAAKQATSVIPIVFAAVGDPVGNGLVVSLARPGGNVTGSSLQATDLAGKRLGLLREAVPGLRRLAIMANSDSPAPVVEMREAQATARTLGLEVVTTEIRRPEDIAPAFETLKGRAQGLYVCNDPLVTTHRTRITALALGVRLPTMFNVREFVEAGGLMSYGPNFLVLYRRAADFVDKNCTGRSRPTSRWSSRLAVLIHHGAESCLKIPAKPLIQIVIRLTIEPDS